MSGTDTVQIVISKRTIRIDNQVYPLANVSRMQTLELKYKETAADAVGKLFGILFVAVVAIAFLSEAGVGQAEQLVGLVYVFAALGVTIFLGIAVHRLLRRRIYALLIETSGFPAAILAHYDWSAIRDVEKEIIFAIENPPDNPKSFYIENVIMGDKIGRDKFQQIGHGNTMNNSR